MSTRHFFVAVVALVLMVASVGCKGSSSPIAPSPPQSIVNPAPGTQVASFPLPGTDKPLDVWITGFSPAKDSQLTEGQVVSVGYTCNGPAGYEAIISLGFVTDASDPLPSGRSGSLLSIAGKCGGHMLSSSFTATRGQPDKNYIRIVAWVGRIPELQQWTPPKPPDFHHEQYVGYKSPR